MVSLANDFGLCIMILHCDGSLESLDGPRANRSSISIVQFNIYVRSKATANQPEEESSVWSGGFHVHRFGLFGRVGKIIDMVFTAISYFLSCIWILSREVHERIRYSGVMIPMWRNINGILLQL